MRWMPFFLQMSPLLFVSVVFSGCSTAPSGPEKFPVRGSVQINGSPAVQVAVTLHHTDPAVQGNLRYATGVTGADGRFELSCEGDRDGAVAGDYRVSMAWMSSPELDAFDMLQSAYSDPAKTGIVAWIPVADGELQPFVLTVPEEKIRRPGGSSEASARDSVMEWIRTCHCFRQSRLSVLSRSNVVSKEFVFPARGALP